MAFWMDCAHFISIRWEMTDMHFSSGTTSPAAHLIVQNKAHDNNIGIAPRGDEVTCTAEYRSALGNILPD